MKIITLMFVLLLSFSCAHHGKHHHDKSAKKFEYLDKNKDGKISKKEWMAKFKKKDKNKDGFLSLEEMSWKKCHECKTKDCHKKDCDAKNCENKECSDNSCHIKK